MHVAAMDLFLATIHHFIIGVNHIINLYSTYKCLLGETSQQTIPFNIQRCQRENKDFFWEAIYHQETDSATAHQKVRRKTAGTASHGVNTALS